MDEQNRTAPEEMSLDEAYKLLDADVLSQLSNFIDKALQPLSLKTSPEQRKELVTAVNAYMTSESEDARELEKLNDVIDTKVRAFVHAELGVDGGSAFDDLCDRICDAVEEAVEETAIYGQMKGHEMMGAMFGVESTGPVRVEDGEVLTTVAMGGGVRNPDGSWTEFGDDLGKVQ